MLQRSRGIALASGAILIVAIITVVVFRDRPSADVSNQLPDQPKVVWGKISDETGTPLPGIRVTIGEDGAVTGPGGYYLLSTVSVGRVPVYFTHSVTDETYDIAGDSENALNLDSDKSNKTDFQLKKSAKQSDSIVVSPPVESTPLPEQTVIPSQTPTSVTTATSSATPFPQPANPARLTTRALRNPSRVDVKWRDNAVNESGFTIIRTEAKTFLVMLIDVPANSITFTDITAEKGKTYFYKVRAYSGTGATKSYSAYSNERKISVK